jgi:prevent-host-death family protein
MRKIIPITDLQRQAGQIVSEMTEANEAVVITQRGRAAAVLMPARRFVEIEEDLARLDELELQQFINRAEEDIAQGRTVPHRKVKARLGRRRAVARPR